MNEGSLQNNYQYQGDFSEMDEDIGWNDFALRNYNSQIGRWVQQDPFDEFPSPYTGMGNDPVNNIDPSGGWAATGLFEGLSQTGIKAVTTLTGAIVGTAVDLISGGDGGKGLLIGASLGLASNGSIGNFAFASLKVGGEVLSNTVNNSVISQSTNSYAKWAGYNPQQPITVDNTREAFDHYFNGNGEPVNIGPKTTFSILTSPEFKYHESRIVSGQIDKGFMNGNFSVDMTRRIFHIGRTNVDYSISCITQNCTVTFSLFVRDGFWDVDFIDENTLGKIGIKQFQPDGMGPNLERLGGHPFHYNPVIIKFNFLNPGY